MLVGPGPGSVVVLQGCVKVFLLVGSFPQLFPFWCLHWFWLGVLLGKRRWGRCSNFLSSSILPTSTPSRILRVVTVRGPCSSVPRSDCFLLLYHLWIGRISQQSPCPGMTLQLLVQIAHIERVHEFPLCQPSLHIL